MDEIFKLLPALIITLIIIGVISVIVINYYNRMRAYKNEIFKIWTTLRVAIEKQFALVETNINLLEGKVDIPSMREFINGYKIMALTSDVTLAYVRLEKTILSIDSPILNSFSIANNSINQAKVLYNQYVLEYNNMVNMFPGKIVAKIFGFSPEVYFINKD